MQSSGKQNSLEAEHFHQISLFSQFSQIVYHSASIFPNSEYLANATLNVFNDTDGLSMLNASGTLKVDLPKPMIYITVLTRSKGSREYQTYSKPTIDVCKVEKGVFGGFIVRTIASNIKNYSNFRFECPLKKQFFYVTNYPVFDIKVASLFLLKNENQSPEFDVTFTIKGKPAGKKSFVNIMTGRITGQVLM